jgi:TRAP-type uncharacterized transport system fused permease subunit
VIRIRFNLFPVVLAIFKLVVLPLAVHMFVFYFGIISAVTPPVALVAYAAAGIAYSDLMKTGLQAMRLGLSGFVIPFMFVLGPSILLIGTQIFYCPHCHYRHPGSHLPVGGQCGLRFGSVTGLGKVGIGGGRPVAH